MNNLEEFFVKLLSITTMLALGLATSKSDIRKNLKWHTLGMPLLLSLIILPAISLVTISTLDNLNSPGMIGLFIAVAAAGGSSAGVFVKLAKGNDSISGTLVVTQALLSSILLPLFLGTILSQRAATTSILPLTMTTFLYQLLPFGVGFLLTEKNLSLSNSSKLISRFNTLALLILITGFAVQSYDQIFHISSATWTTIIIINAIAFIGPSLSKSLAPISATIAPTLGVRNLTMALLIVSTLETTIITTAPILVYGLVMYLGTILRLSFDLSSWRLNNSKL